MLENTPIIQFENYSFKYDAQQKATLKNINLTIRKGEKILIAGPSGCGKSTLIHSMNGLIPSSYRGEISGSLTIAGKNAGDLSIFDLSKIVGTVLQDSDGQFVGLTVAEDIAFALENDCVPGLELHERVREAAENVGISSHLHHSPNELSGGQKQKVSLAGVIVDNVDVMLFDEPLANLDPAAGKYTIELISEMQEKTGAAVVIVEHRLEDVLWRDVDRIVLMSNGEIVMDAPPEKLLATDLLSRNGIREPLYLTALKYAGVEVTSSMHPESIQKLALDGICKEKVRAWYRQTFRNEPKEKRADMISVENLQFSYPNGKKAIKGISAEIRKGEMVAIVGTNGAGKSTFSKLLCGFETQQEGIIRLKGENVEGLSIKERADHIGYVMQNPNKMISQIMIFDEVALGLRTRTVPEEEIRERVNSTLQICGLWPFRNWPVSALSYGQKKRVTIASILSMNPEVLILDEPSAGQDYRHYTEIMEFLREINHLGVTVIMITHDLHLMLEYADRAIVFHDGRILADDTCASVLGNEEIVRRANLKKTSLYELAEQCGITDSADFVQKFIDYERKVVRS